jgi:hypothetical protein
MKTGSIRQRSDLEEEESYVNSVAKRSKPPDTGKMSDHDDDMVVETTTNTAAAGAILIPSAPDDILIDMIQSGQYSHTQVVQFCLSAGIPLSRMLRLDLMRLNSRPPPT